MADQRDRTNAPNDASNDIPRVALLSKLGDFKVAEGSPDPRGWDVIASDGMKVGKVHDLVVDTGGMRTRYLDIRLDTDIAGDGDDRDVLLPVGAASLDDQDDHVVVGMTMAQIAAFPVYSHGSVTREYENAVLLAMPERSARSNMPSGMPSDAQSDDYYSSHHFDDSGLRAPRNAANTANTANTANATRQDTLQHPVADALQDTGTARLTRSEEELDISKRQVSAGQVDVHKTVETEHVSRPVTLQHEEVTVERRPVSAERLASGDMGVQETDDEIRIPVIEEEVVMETRQVVKEEIIIRKHAVSEEKTVEADLRKERIDIEGPTSSPTNS
ncbi:MAG: DUF2382 domain-containing protein [Gemmatimonadaceae bacterium]